MHKLAGRNCLFFGIAGGHLFELPRSQSSLIYILEGMYIRSAQRPFCGNEELTVFKTFWCDESVVLTDEGRSSHIHIMGQMQP